MIREWADEERIARIDDALEPPADWRDPSTGMPAGWSDDGDTWAEWEQSMQ